MTFPRQSLRATAIVLLTILGAGTAGCTGSPLTVARLTYEQDVSRASQGMLRVVSFEKTNGISQNMYGQRLYELDFRAVVEFVQPGWTNSGAMFTLESPYHVYNQQPTGWDAWGNDFQYHEAGARISFTGTMTLLKKENGWERT
jgi:hypothetical protein